MPLDALPAPANMRLGTKSGGGYGGKGGECSETSPKFMPLDALPAPANMRLGTKSGGGYGGKGGENVVKLARA